MNFFLGKRKHKVDNTDLKKLPALSISILDHECLGTAGAPFSEVKGPS